MSWHFPAGIGTMKRCWQCDYRGPWIFKTSRHFPTETWKIGRADLSYPIPHICFKDKNMNSTEKSTESFFTVVVEGPPGFDIDNLKGIEVGKSVKHTLVEARNVAKTAVEQNPQVKAYICKAVEVFETQTVVSRRLA